MPPDHPRFIPSPSIRRYALDADSVLFDCTDSRIYILNETGALLWQALEQGLDIADVADRLAGQTGADRQQVLADCRTLVGQWHNARLGDAGTAPGLGARTRAAGAQEAASNAIAPPDRTGTAVSAEPLPSPDEADTERRYRIADLCLTIRAGGRAFALINGLFNHCAAPDEPAGSADRATLYIVQRQAGWILFLDDLPLKRCETDETLAPIVHATVMHLSYVASQSRLAIHGAALFAGDRCVLLPGRAGAGKSTLTAALVNAGLGYCCDDLTLLGGDPLRLRGVPLCIGLKRGSWPLLSETVPAIDALPIHLREDEQQVKYLPPPAGRTARPDQAFGVAAIVFPRLVPGAPCRLEPMPRSAALLRIADCGYHLMGELDAETLEAMLDWLASLECYELSYSALDGAVMTVRGLLD